MTLRNNGRKASLKTAAATAALSLGLAMVSMTGSAAAAGKVGFSSPFLTDPFQAILANQSVDQIKAIGLEPLAATNANGDPGKQSSDVKNLIAAGANALIINPADSEAIIPVVKFANEKNVPVVMIDIAPSGGKLAMIVRANNKEFGQKACEALGKAIGGKGKVLSLLGDQATTNGRDRTTGFNDCMKANFPDAEIIEKPTYWKTDKATSEAQTVVTTTPDLAAIYMQSDSVMLAGVLNVLKSGGKQTKVGEAGHIFLATIDGTPYALGKIREGLVDVTISQPLDLYAKYGAYYANAAIEGKTFQVGKTDHNSEIVAVGDNLMDYVPATVVTAENVDADTLWGNAKQ